MHARNMMALLVALASTAVAAEEAGDYAAFEMEGYTAEELAEMSFPDMLDQATVITIEPEEPEIWGDVLITTCKVHVLTLQATCVSRMVPYDSCDEIGMTWGIVGASPTEPTVMIETCWEGA